MRKHARKSAASSDFTRPDAALLSAQKFLLSAHKFAPTDTLMPKETTAEIHERVAFELALKRVVDGREDATTSRAIDGPAARW